VNKCGKVSMTVPNQIRELTKKCSGIAKSCAIVGEKEGIFLMQGCYANNNARGRVMIHPCKTMCEVIW
jgi:hypothetical protein